MRRSRQVAAIVCMIAAFGAAAVASAQLHEGLINEDFEGAVFPPQYWQASGAELTTEAGRSPEHSVKLPAADSSISVQLQPEGVYRNIRKLDFYARYNQVGAMVRLDYSTDGSSWTFLRKFTGSPGSWLSPSSTSLMGLPGDISLRFSWDEYNNPGAVIYIDDVRVSTVSIIRSNPSSNQVLPSADYSGDGLADIGIFRPDDGLWAIRGLGRIYFGGSGDLPASGDYNGDGVTDIAVYRPGTGLWAVKDLTRIYFTSGNDVVVPGDYDGDGSCEAALFNLDNALWRVRDLTRVCFGTIDDNPVPGDYDGDGDLDIAVFRPNQGLWAVRGITRAYFGSADDYPVPGRYRWYGSDRSISPFRCRIALFRPSTGLWAIRGISRFYFGGEGDLPVKGEYSGGLPEETGIFRPSSGLWAIRGITRSYFGESRDIPLAE